MDGYDDCIAGVVERFGQPPIVCYDKANQPGKYLEDGMRREPRSISSTTNSARGLVDPRHVS